MKNKSLANDYITRAGHRLAAVEVLLARESHADVVRESSARPHATRLAKISKAMRRDRELAFYGSEDLTPSEFYKEEDSKEALENARWVHSVCLEALPQS